MDFVSIAVNLKHKPVHQLSISDARFAHAAIMSAITDINKDAGKGIHDSRHYKPITLAIVSPQRNSAILRLTFINSEGIRYANLLISKLMRSPMLRLGDLECDVDTIETNTQDWSGIGSWRGLIEKKAPDQGFTIEFHTPTAINKLDDQNKRFTGLLPDPLTIFTGLSKKWKQLDGPLLAGDITNFINTGGCVVSNYKIETITFELPAYKQKGFQGKVTYEFRKSDPDCMKSISSLARFAYFSGIGYHTTQGMGAVRIRETGDA